MRRKGKTIAFIIFFNFRDMNSLPKSVQDIKEYFNATLFPHYDMEEIKNFCLLSLEKYLHISRAELRLKSAMAIHEDVAKKFEQVVEELLTNKPIQYILGETEFYGLKILVDENVLIPRQETEELVDWIIQEFKVPGLRFQIGNSELRADINRVQNFNILDIGTGSGCIAIALKKNLMEAYMSALDISEGALKIAKSNASLNGVDLKFIQQNILTMNSPSSIDRAGEKYDIIVSNPPYIRQSESSVMHKNVLDYEPHLALFVEDENPLLFYEAIANFANIYLKEKGKLYVEINEALGKDVVELLTIKGFAEIVMKRDLNGKNRMVRAIKV